MRVAQGDGGTNLPTYSVIARVETKYPFNKYSYEQVRFTNTLTFIYLLDASQTTNL